MKKFSIELLVWAYCWTHSTGRCKDGRCAGTFKPCKNFVDMRWKIFRYRHYCKSKAKFPTTLDMYRKRVNPKYKL